MSSHHTSQRFCLRWNNHQSNLLSVFDQLLHDESFVDVTLAVEGQFLRAHKMVLSACSPYFQALFVGHPDKHPIVILKDVPYADMRSLLDFMYRGEVSVDQDRLTAFLKVAESLRIKGLTEVNEERCDLPSIASSLLSSAGFTQQTTSQQQQTQQQQQQSQPPLLHRIHVPTKRSIHSNSMASNPLLGSALTAPKRKRGRPRRLSGSDEHRNQSHKSSTDSEDQRHDDDSDAPSSGVHGPPDLLEVNMPEFHSPPSRLSQSDNSPPPSEDGNLPLAIEDSDRKVKPELEEPTPGTSQQECGSGGQSPKSSSADSESKLPSDLPKLRLVPKSELMAIKRNDAHNDHHFLVGHNIDGDGELDRDNNNDSSNCLEMSGESSDKSLALVPSESSGNCFSEPPLPRPPIRRRVRRRAASSNDPAEQLTEMSVRGLNLFRYASVSDGVYKCTECAKSDILKTFKNKYSFQRHAFLYHEGCHRKVFPCPVCAKQFSRPDKMKNHMKTVHECYVPKDIIFPNVPFFMQPPPSAHVSPELKFTQEMKFPSDEIITHH